MLMTSLFTRQAIRTSLSLPGTPKQGPDEVSNHSETPEVQDMDDDEAVYVSAPIQLEESAGMDTSRAQANDFEGSFLKVAEFEDQ